MVHKSIKQMQREFKAEDERDKQRKLAKENSPVHIINEKLRKNIKSSHNGIITIDDILTAVGSIFTSNGTEISYGDNKGFNQWLEYNAKKKSHVFIRGYDEKHINIGSISSALWCGFITNNEISKDLSISKAQATRLLSTLPKSALFYVWHLGIPTINGVKKYGTKNRPERATDTNTYLALLSSHKFQAMSKYLRSHLTEDGVIVAKRFKRLTGNEKVSTYLKVKAKAVTRELIISNQDKLINLSMKMVKYAGHQDIPMLTKVTQKYVSLSDYIDKERASLHNGEFLAPLYQHNISNPKSKFLKHFQQYLKQDGEPPSNVSRLAQLGSFFKNYDFNK